MSIVNTAAQAIEMGLVSFTQPPESCPSRTNKRFIRYHKKVKHVVMDIRGSNTHSTPSRLFIRREKQTVHVVKSEPYEHSRMSFHSSRMYLHDGMSYKNI